MCGRRQVVRHQPSKLISAGSNPVARSVKSVPVPGRVTHDTRALDM